MRFHNNYSSIQESYGRNVTDYRAGKLLLVVSFLLNPATRVSTQQVLSRLVVAPDEDGEGDGGQPPVDLQGVHPQALVHARGVGEDAGKGRLEEESKVHEVVLHALLEHRELPGLADDEIGPLDDHDGDKEGSVASVLQLLPVSIGPLLPIGVLQVVHCLRIPGSPEAKEVAGPESVLTEDHEVDKESCRCLDHSNLSVSHGDETLVDQLVCEGVPWGTLHDVGFSILVGHGDGWHHVCAKGQGHVSKDEEEEGGDLRDVGGQGVGDGLLEVVKDQPALLYSSDPM